MANTDNSCKDLKIDQNKYDQFDKIFQMQKELQESGYGYKFKDMSIQDIAKFWFMNKHAIEDEFSEMFDALGGIKDGIGNAAWKPWKTKNEEAITMSPLDLSKGDRQELLMEMVDAFHFFMNFVVSAGFTGSDIANAYMAKNEENYRRIKDGY
ncbi:MAG: hypothetical protein CL596_05315 [Alteromonas sp.]|nr:hypothetical protein [Alteromonas sp.]|tara:strand:+ start:1555 stop:2013 length:459 start_codon:yes stop_codon:yes gene_type:complete